MQKSKFPDRWEQARKKELDSLKKFNVFTEIDRQDIPNDHPDPIGCRWLYTLKHYPYDTYQKQAPEAEAEATHKARLIVQGMNEECDDTYSPTPMAESIRLVITLAVSNNWDIRFTDVSTAFLHADVIGNPYVYPPETENLDNTNTVWKLNKAQYGLKSAPKAWNQHLTKVLKGLGWTQSVLDECIFFKQNQNIEKEESETPTTVDKFPITGLIAVYVDDLIVCGTTETTDEFYKEFEKSCTISAPERLEVNGPEVTFLGFQYSRHENYVKINPKEYVKKILIAFDCIDCKPRATPGQNSEFEIDKKEREKFLLDKYEHKIYRRIVGQTLWVSSIRRDVAFPVKELSKHAHDPTKQDMLNAIHLLKYLKGTIDECVYIKPIGNNGKFEITVFTDADLGGCRTSRKSTSGGCIALSGEISHTWAGQQNTIADSSAESEFTGLAQACKEAK